MKVKELNESERPREHAMQVGIHALNNRELVALLLRSGTRKKSALEVADEVLKTYENLGELGVSTLYSLMQIDGIKEAKALELQAAFELGRRIAFEEVKRVEELHCPEDIANWLCQQIGFERQENFIVLFLNQKNQVESFQTMFTGTMTSASVHPREIFKAALAKGCAKILCVHNHPSGDPTPSEADIEITNAIEECSRLTHIPLVDHVIVAKNSFLSFRQKHLID